MVGGGNGILCCMSETLLPHPETLRAWIAPSIARKLLSAGDPARLNPGAVERILAGDGIFEATLITAADNPEGAFYNVPYLDAAIIAHQGLLTAQQVREALAGEPPEVIIAPETEDDRTPIILPLGLILDAQQTLSPPQTELINLTT
jgi:hypothetical protein